MNNEMNNLNLTMDVMNESLDEGNYLALKTLINVYNSMLSKFVNLKYKELIKNSIGDKLEKRLPELKTLKSHLLEVSYPNSIKRGNYKDSHKIQYIMDELDEVILKLEKLVKYYCDMRDVDNVMNSDINITNTVNNSEKFKNTENLLDASIKSGVLIKQLDKSLRGTGKTTALIKKAHELDVVLLTSGDYPTLKVNELAESLNLRITVFNVNYYHSSYNAVPEGVLVDDSVDDKKLDMLIKNGEKILGGFTL